MIQKQPDYGLVRMTNYLPTAQAKRYYHCCLVAGWHRNNALYHLNYPQGFPAVLVILTVDGQGWIRIHDHRYALPKGSIAFVSSETPMEYGTDTSCADPVWEFYWLNLDGDYIQSFATKLREDGLSVCCNIRLQEYLPVFQSLLENNDTTRYQEKLHSDQIQQLCSLLLEDCLLADMPAVDQRIDRILRYLQTHYSEDVHLDHLGQLFYLSPNHLIRLFRASTGYTPYEYVKRFRLLKAGEWLQTSSLPIHEIAQKVGYGNQSHFAAQFRALYGLTPREYRLLFSSL